MKKIILYTIPILVIGLSILSCMPSTVGGGADPLTLLDNWDMYIKTDSGTLYFNANAGANSFTAGTVNKIGRTDQEVPVLALDFSMLRAGGRNGINAQFTEKRNLSAYNALTFWAKAETADSQIEKIIVEDGNSDTGDIWLKR